MLGTVAVEIAQQQPGTIAIQARRRLVAKDDSGVVHERPCGGHALLLAGRELLRTMVESVTEPEVDEDVLGSHALLPSRHHPGEPGRAENVLKRGQRVEQAEGLEYIAYAACAKPITSRLSELVEVRRVDLDQPLAWAQKPRDDMQERRLTGAVLPLER